MLPLPISSCGGRVIRRIFLSNNIYHAVAQSYDGKIYHEKFDNERDAKQFLERFENPERPRGVQVERIGG